MQKTHLKIKSLDASTFNQNPGLKIAFVSHNEMEALEAGLLANHAELKRVDVGDNQIKKISKAFEVRNSCRQSGDIPLSPRKVSPYPTLNLDPYPNPNHKILSEEQVKFSFVHDWVVN